MKPMSISDLPSGRRQYVAETKIDTGRAEAASRVAFDGVEQLSRDLNRDPLLAPVQGVFAANEIKPQARTLAEDRGIRCVVLDYDALRGVDNAQDRLF